MSSLTLRRWHRRIGLIVGVPGLLWGLSGATLALKNFVRPEMPGAPAAVAGARTPFSVSIDKSLQVAGRGEPDSVTRRWLLGHPRYELRYDTPPQLVLVDGLAPRLLEPLQEDLARRIAAADAPGAQVTGCRLQTGPSLYYRPGRELPAFRVSLDNGDDVYVSPQTGQVLLHMDALGRVFRVAFFVLHLWDLSLSPDPGGHASYLLLASAALLLLCVGVSGLWLALGRRGG